MLAVHETEVIPVITCKKALFRLAPARLASRRLSPWRLRPGFSGRAGSTHTRTAGYVYGLAPTPPVTSMSERRVSGLGSQSAITAKMPPMTSVPQARADTGEAGCCRSVCAIAYRSPFSDLLRTLHPLLSSKIYFSALAPFSTPDMPSHQQGPTHHCHYRRSRAADPLLRLMRPSRSSWWHLPLRSPGGSLYNSQVGKELS
jgi:hypothetical protein